MYKHLVEIGLKDYIDNYFSNKQWSQDKYLDTLDGFLESKSKEEKEILRKKFQNQKKYRKITDQLYEVVVNLVSHPKARILDPNLDKGDLLCGNVYIEVKNINPPPAEIERIEKLVPDSMSYGPFPDDDDYESRLTAKFEQQLAKALEQLNGKGIIYIMWDTTLKGSYRNQPKINSLMNTLSNKAMLKNSHISVITMDFQDLMEKARSSNS